MPGHAICASGQLTRGGVCGTALVMVASTMSVMPAMSIVLASVLPAWSMLYLLIGRKQKRLLGIFTLAARSTIASTMVPLKSSGNVRECPA